MYHDCDFVEDNEGNFWIIAGNHHERGILGSLVYEAAPEGDRRHPNGCSYRKVTDYTHERIHVPSVARHFEPRTGFAQHSRELQPPWSTFLEGFRGLGIQDDDIGIFGAVLLGFPLTKDVDFVLYGKNNRDILRAHIDEFKQSVGGADISADHVLYQTTNKGRYFNPLNSFAELLPNKWSSVQISPTVLSTIRFVYDDPEIAPDLWAAAGLGEQCIEGIVSRADGTDFCPRTFCLSTNDSTYLVGTHFWIYQSCLRDGMHIRVSGTRRQGNVMTLDSVCDYIQVLQRD